MHVIILPFFVVRSAKLPGHGQNDSVIMSSRHVKCAKVIALYYFFVALGICGCRNRAAALPFAAFFLYIPRVSLYTQLTLAKLFNEKKKNDKEKRGAGYSYKTYCFSSEACPF